MILSNINLTAFPSSARNLDGFQSRYPPGPKIAFFFSLIKKLLGLAILPGDCGTEEVPCPFYGGSYLEFPLSLEVFKTLQIFILETTIECFLFSEGRG